MLKPSPDKSLLRHLPKVDEVLAHPLVRELAGKVPELTLKKAVRDEINTRRADVLSCEITGVLELSLETVAAATVGRALTEDRPRLRQVFNANGVVIYTNLGRSPLSEDAIRQIGMAAKGYSNLEYNINGGERGSRDDLVEELLCRLTGTETATVVNNNAAAAALWT